MNQYEVPVAVADQLPELRKKIIYLSALGNIHQSIHILTDYTMKMVRLHRLHQVVHCMRVASRLYIDGNEAVKNAVENGFVYSFTIMRMHCTKAEWAVVEEHIPKALYAAYVHQVSDPGC